MVGKNFQRQREEEERAVPRVEGGEERTREPESPGCRL